MFEIFVIEGCPYSERAMKILRDSKIKHKTIHVPTKNKAAYKTAHKMNTFPQIFYHTRKGDVIKVGGCQELEELLTIVQNLQKTKPPA